MLKPKFSANRYMMGMELGHEGPNCPNEEEEAGKKKMTFLHTLSEDTPEYRHLHTRNSPHQELWGLHLDIGLQAFREMKLVLSEVFSLWWSSMMVWLVMLSGRQKCATEALAQLLPIHEMLSISAPHFVSHKPV